MRTASAMNWPVDEDSGAEAKKTDAKPRKTDAKTQSREGTQSWR